VSEEENSIFLPATGARSRRPPLHFLSHWAAPEQFAQLMTSRKQAIERSMQADRERFEIELSNIIPDEVMNRAFELLSVTREEVVRQLDAKEQEGKR